MKFPNQRLVQLFTLLQNETLPQDELARRLNVSTRTVRTDINVLNELLADYAARFVLSRSTGYQLKIDDADRFQQLIQQSPCHLRVPRNSAERINYLLTRFLTSAFSLKLEDLADEWFVSRSTLQNDMAGVRERLGRYHLVIETKPRYGMKLFGSEVAIRTCLTSLLYQIALEDSDSPLLKAGGVNSGILAWLQPLLRQSLSLFNIRLADDGEYYLLLYFAVSLRRISEGYPLTDFSAEDVDDEVRAA